MGRGFSGGMSSSSGGGFGGHIFRHGRNSGGVPFIIRLVILFVVILFSKVENHFDFDDIKTNKYREPLTVSTSTEFGYFEDDLGWITSPEKLEIGMKEFYKDTGVQPYLYIVDNVNVSTSPKNFQVKKFMNKKYDELFTDESHLLLLFLYNGKDYGAWILTGSDANTVIDADAQNIMHKYIDKYFNSYEDKNEMFSQIFYMSSKTIMGVDK